MEVIGCQVHAIGKAIRPLFTDLVTFINTKKITRVLPETLIVIRRQSPSEAAKWHLISSDFI